MGELITTAGDAYFSIGQEYDSNQKASNFYIGEIDEIRIWNTVRTEAEITANMDIPLRGDEPGLVSYYRADDTTGSTL